MDNKELREVIKEEIRLYENEILVEGAVDTLLKPIPSIGTGAGMMIVTSLGGALVWAVLGALLILASPILSGIKITSKGEKKPVEKVSGKELLKKIYKSIMGLKTYSGEKILPKDIGMDAIEQEVKKYIESHELYGSHKGIVTRFKNDVGKALRGGKKRDIIKAYKKYVKLLIDKEKKIGK